MLKTTQSYVLDHQQKVKDMTDVLSLSYAVVIGHLELFGYLAFTTLKLCCFTYLIFQWLTIG